MDLWIAVCKKQYPEATVTERNYNGLQLRIATAYSSNKNCEWLGSVSLTFHRGTYRIHVQGSLYNPLARRALWSATKTGGSTNTGNRQGRQ